MCLYLLPYPKYVQPFYNDVQRFESDNKKWELPFHVIDTDYYRNILNQLEQDQILVHLRLLIY